ncbi:MAG: immunoglobulin-like domain-containing protein [Lachnospiraceae bacterium]
MVKITEKEIKKDYHMKKNRIAALRSIGITVFCLLLCTAGCGTSQQSKGEEGNPAETVTGVPDKMLPEDLTPTPEPISTSTPTPEQLPEQLTKDYEALSVRDAEGIKGNIHLETRGKHGSVITWESSHPEIISDKEVENPGYDSTPAGIVIRQSDDVKVILTATLTYEGAVLQKKFEVTVLAAPDEKKYTDYLFAYFTGNEAGQEAISISVSRDAYQWEELNGGKPILTSTLGTKGLRDPFIIRSAEGDCFFLIATDLCIASDGDWWKAQTNGSQSIMIWESEDLVNWSEQRMLEINLVTAGCTWAPEAYYDKKTGEYLVFWASRVSTDHYAKQSIYYVKTRDFYTFTYPELWMDYPYDTIDATVIEEGDYYYRFTKYEEKSLVIMERAESLLGEWTIVESGMLAKQGGVEGPCCFAVNEDDIVDGNRYILLLDSYGGIGYYMMEMKELAGGEMARKRKGASLPASKPRHGTVIPLTEEEYERVVAAYGN